RRFRATRSLADSGHVHNMEIDQISIRAEASDRRTRRFRRDQFWPPFRGPTASVILSQKRLADVAPLVPNLDAPVARLEFGECCHFSCALCVHLIVKVWRSGSFEGV